MTKSKITILTLLLALGLSLRLYHLGTVPKHNETADEYGWTWSGMSLVQEGVPRSWSWLRSYPEGEMVSWKGAPYRMVQPWLDHPPLYSALMGVWMTVVGSRDPFAVNLSRMRLSSVLLFGLTFCLLAMVLTRFSDDRLLYATLFFFAIAPPSVFHGRLVVSENLFTAMFLAGYLLLLCCEQKESSARIIALAAFAMTLPLIKLPALVLSAALFALAVLRKRRNLMLAVAGGTVLGVILDLLYGWHFGWHLFVDVLRAQRNRFTGFHGLHELLFVPKLVYTPIFYAPFLLGLMAILTGLVKRFEIGVVVLLYAAGMTFLVADKEVFGWYLIPLYPFLCMGIATFICKMLDDWQGLATPVWALFSITYAILILADRHPGNLSFLRWLYLGIMILVGALLVWNRECEGRWQRGVVAGLLALQGCADLYFVLSAG